MTEVEYSDDERYANESFENESDGEVPEVSEIYSEVSDNDDNDDEEDLPSIKINTGPIRRTSFAKNFSTHHKTDVVPYASSSEEEDDVIVGQTMAEINTPSMMFNYDTPRSSNHNLVHKSMSGETSSNRPSTEADQETSEEEISEEEVCEEEEDEEFKRIKDIEKKYLQQNSAKTPKSSFREEPKISSEDNVNEVTYTLYEQECKVPENTSNDREPEEEPESEFDDGSESESREQIDNSAKQQTFSNDSIQLLYSSEYQHQFSKQNNSVESFEEENNLMQLIQTSLKFLKLSSNEMMEPLLLNKNESMGPIDATQILNTDEIALAVVNALKGNGLTNLMNRNHDRGDVQISEPNTNSEASEELYIKQDSKEHQVGEYTLRKEQDTSTEIVEYKDDYEEDDEKEIELEEIQNDKSQVSEQDNYDDNGDVYYNGQFDYHITSRTPTSFNSDDYIFHANFIKTFNRTSSKDKFGAKLHQRKSMSFSNERMREIERHNQILLRKILTQKPTYTLKNKTSQTSVQKLPSQTNVRLTTSALNRKKQQRQIDLDNQVLKKKIEAIALRRRPLMP